MESARDSTVIFLPLYFAHCEFKKRYIESNRVAIWISPSIYTSPTLNLSQYGLSCVCCVLCGWHWTWILLGGRFTRIYICVCVCMWRRSTCAECVWMCVVVRFQVHIAGWTSVCVGWLVCVSDVVRCIVCDMICFSSSVSLSPKRVEPPQWCRTEAHRLTNTIHMLCEICIYGIQLDTAQDVLCSEAYIASTTCCHWITRERVLWVLCMVGLRAFFLHIYACLLVRRRGSSLDSLLYVSKCISPALWWCDSGEHTHTHTCSHKFTLRCI